jgi:hypothetical protein
MVAIMEIDINVRCPECGLVMVRHRNPDYISCGFSECENNGIQYELPKIAVHKIVQENEQQTGYQPKQNGSRELHPPSGGSNVNKSI